MISVVVPAYRRPDFLDMLIRSFNMQDFADKELVIVDDSGADTRVEDLIKDKYITQNNLRYIKNEHNLGFCKNLIKSITAGSGDYILILGDDDMFASEQALTRYVEVFTDNPNVGFIYSNQIQFNNNYDADYIYPHFSKDILFDSTEDALVNIWLLSCFISGIALRNFANLAKLYPEDTILFPQVEMIGKLLCSSQAYGIAEYLIGARAHDEQLGFKAVKSKDIKGTEKHSVYELNTIYNKIGAYYTSMYNLSLKTSRNFVNDFFENKHMTIFPGEKINTGNTAIFKVFVQSVRNNPAVLLKYRYLMYFIAALVLPKSLLIRLKDAMKAHYMKSYLQESAAFLNFVNRLC